LENGIICTMDKQAEIREIIESSNINFLIGAGISDPFLPLLQSIETRLTAEQDEKKRIPIYKEYFEKVMCPNLDVIDNTVDKSVGSNFQITYGRYKDFFESISHILLRRKSTILSKQANLFTTNIDVMMETVMEDSNLDYNDGFSGKLNPTFSLSNFKRSILKRSLHFENVSEIPVINLIKVHGSLTWNKGPESISLSKLTHFSKDLLSVNDSDFKIGYDKIAVVNPEPKKFKETVIDLTYYELLRMYSSELEKENSVLFVMGFSMADQHIREITIRSADSNPTLKIYIFCHSKSRLAEMEAIMNVGQLKYSNIEIIAPEDDQESNKYNLGKINEVFFARVASIKKDDISEK
ncbi:MAG: SIR2 family protein, partial [Candidatus Obscuribacterales bacterium]|nr:SIR2 family protein [Candidatus Obscuribacterales bacterium]